MSPKFAAAVDPVILYVLHVLERIENNDALDPQEVKVKVLGQISQAQERLANHPDWQLAKYALVCWAEENLKEAPWPGAEHFVMNSLEFELFGMQEYHTRFYVKAKEAGASGALDALEVFYICVVLGFRGFYSDADADSMAVTAHDLSLPLSIEAWANQTAAQIKHGTGRRQAESRSAAGDGAPPLWARFHLLAWSTICLVLAVAAGVMAYVFFVSDPA
jgi:type VI secretion system protein ImpK